MITDHKTLITEKYKEPVDFKQFNKILSGLQTQQVNGIIDLYFQELPDYLIPLQQAIASQDGQALFSAAHKFKGASAFLGAQRIVALCKILEQLGQNDRFDQTTELLAQIKVESETLKQVLENQKSNG